MHLLILMKLKREGEKRGYHVYMCVRESVHVFFINISDRLQYIHLASASLLVQYQVYL